MRKVRLQFTLAGQSAIFMRGMPKHTASEIKNSEIFDYVRGVVANRFGDRAIHMVDEKSLKFNPTKYPKYFSAGWFVSDDAENVSELVVVAHSDNFEHANRKMMDAVCNVEWDLLAVNVEM